MQSSVANAHSKYNPVATYTEFEDAILISEEISYENNIGKFVIPTLTTSMNNTQEVVQQIPKKGTANVINRENLGLSSITATNYFELPVPKHLFYIESIDIIPNTRRGGEDNCLVACNPKTVITRNKYIKGQKFIIANIDNPIILGVKP